MLLKPYNIKIFCLLIFSLWNYKALALSTNYAEVLVENLQIGCSYNFTKLLNMPLTIGNNLDKPLKIKLEVEKPDQQNIKKEYEAIPDVKWIDIGPEIAEIPASGQYQTNIKINIPSDEKLLGKKYQFNIQSRENREGQGFIVNFAVNSRFFFTVAPVKDQKPSLPVRLNFSLLPERVHMSDLVLGRQYQILTDKQKPIEIVNDQKQKLTVNLTVLNPTYIPMTIDQGYEPGPNPDFISFPKDEITLGPKSRKPVRLFLEIPDEKQYQGKHYLFLVAFRTGEVTSGQQLLRVFVSTAGPEDEKAGVQEPGAHQSTTP